MSSAEDRQRIAESILLFEARRENGRLAVYYPPDWDGGGEFEVAGINVRHHPAEAHRLKSLIEAGRHEQAEKEACEYIALYTDFVARWTKVTGIESYLRDCAFNRGPRGAARILQRALGVEEDGFVGSQTLAAVEAAESDPLILLQQLRDKRESYERSPVGRDESSPPWRGLVNRWNKALDVAKSFLPARRGRPPQPVTTASPATFSAAESVIAIAMAAPSKPPINLLQSVSALDTGGGDIPFSPLIVTSDTRPVTIRAMRLGSTGALVSAWQSFLLGQGFDPGGSDGEFGDKTHVATIAFQAREGLTQDGIAGRETIMRAMQLGFELIEEPAPDTTGSNFPPRPDFGPLVSTPARQAIFGAFDFVSAPTPTDREAIRILGSWKEDNIVDVPIPQLRRALGSSAPATMRFHRLAADQLIGLWAEWEAARLLDRILTFDGAFVARLIRGSRTVLSNHAFGSAFDINASTNGLGVRPPLVGQRGSVRELVPAAHRWGFYWGGHFGTRPDGMHFEIAFLK